MSEMDFRRKVEEKILKTIGKECEISFEEKKSKFIGYIKPVYSKEEAEDFIEKIKKMHPQATHNCSVYSIKENGKEFFKVDDDGEPSGTAGKPMGDIVQYMEVQNLVVVATRYFGGIKLGAGGLIRNYAKTCKLAILEAGIVEYVKKERILIEFPYDKLAEIDRLLSNSTVLEKSFLDRVLYQVELEEALRKIIEKMDYVNII